MTNTHTLTAPTAPATYRGEPIYSSSDLAIAKAEHLMEHLDLDADSFDWAMDRVLDDSVDMLLATPAKLRARARLLMYSPAANVAAFVALLIASGFVPQSF